jgi:ABC-type Fe2+-enterobactin transport system substrate-binding protein
MKKQPTITDPYILRHRTKPNHQWSTAKGQFWTWSIIENQAKMLRVAYGKEVEIECIYKGETRKL